MLLLQKKQCQKDLQDMQAYNILFQCVLEKGQVQTQQIDVQKVDVYCG